MRYRDDGSIQSASIPSAQNVDRLEYFGLLRCMVTKAVFTDESANITANSSTPRVLYECVVLGGFMSGQVLSNCRLASTLGGEFNYYERTLRAASKNVSKTKLQDNDGDIVLVQFVQGHSAYPMIIAIDEGISPSQPGSKSSEGAIIKWQYNGINVEIDKLGDLTLTRKGGKFDDETKAFKPEEDGKKVILKMEKEQITLTLESGLAITIDGEKDIVSIETKGGAKLTVDGEKGEISAQDNGEGKLKISEGKVGLGTSSNELVDLVKQLADALAAATYPGFGAPASNVADYVQIGTKLGQIKGGV